MIRISNEDLRIESLYASLKYITLFGVMKFTIRKAGTEKRGLRWVHDDRQSVFKTGFYFEHWGRATRESIKITLEKYLEDRPLKISVIRSIFENKK